MKSQSHPAQEVKEAVPFETTSSATVERHYTVAEIASMWNLSKDSVRSMFQNEPGVLVLGDTNPRRRKRQYLTLRIPKSVLDRVHRRCSLVSY
jgi:hypothetical protein